MLKTCRNQHLQGLQDEIDLVYGDDQCCRFRWLSSFFAKWNWIKWACSFSRFLWVCLKREYPWYPPRTRIKTAPFLCWSGKAGHFTRWPKRWGTVPIHVQYLLGGDFIHWFCKAIELECSWGFPGEPCRIAWHFWGPCPSNLNLPKRRRPPTPRALRNECMFWTGQIFFCAAAGRVPLMCLSIKESLNLLDTPFRAPSPPVPLTSHTLDINVCSGRGRMWTEGTVMLSLLSWRENEDKPQ